MNSEITNNGSPILAIETSSSLCGACVYFSREKYFETVVNVKNIHAEKLMEIIDSVLKTSALKTGDLKAIAISNGPGSFTGLRIGMSAVKGLAFGASIPLIQVPTFEALALQISRYLPDHTSFIIANKVNLEEVYFAKFQIKRNNYIFVENVKLLKFDEFMANSKDIITFGNAIKLKNSSIFYRTDIFAPQPGYVAEWALEHGQEKTQNNFDYLEPNYLKNFTIKVRKND